LTSSNGGALLYITLGQLPNNPWKIVHDDPVYFAFARDHGFASPYSPEADVALRQAFRAAVAAEPAAFARKVGRNFAMAIIGGVYTGAFATWISKDPDDIHVRGKLGSGSLLRRISRIPQLPLPGLLILAMYALFVPVLLVAYAAVGIAVVKGEPTQRTAHWIVLALVVHCVVVIALTQWEPRHVNPIYAVLMVSAFAQLEARSSTMRRAK
jgi:hypothetical protein